MKPATGCGPAPDEDSIDASASHWVVRQQMGLDESGARELARWRSCDPRHERAFQRLDAMAAALQRARDCGAMEAVRCGLAQRSRRRRARRFALAGATLAIFVGFNVHRSLRNARGEAPAPALVSASPATRHLPDGSTVELKGDSDIAVHFDAEFRRVELRRGEALFHVAKDSSHPFIVRASGVDVRAVGTAFSVRLAPTQVEVLVTEGRVGLNNGLRGTPLLPPEQDGRPASLVAGQRAVIANTDPKVATVASVSSLETEHWLAWRGARVDCDDTELAEAVCRMNASNRVKITLGDGVSHLRISGSFPADDPRTFARLAAETFGLKCEERDAGAIVLRKL